MQLRKCDLPPPSSLLSPPATQVAGVRAAVQLREQDFGNFQDAKKIDQDMNERIQFGRFWFRWAPALRLGQGCEEGATWAPPLMNTHIQKCNFGSGMGGLLRRWRVQQA